MAHLFQPTGPTGPRSQIHVSIGTLPAFTDPKQPPTKKSPWHQLRQIPFVSSISISTTKTFYSTLKPYLEQLNVSLATQSQSPLSQPKYVKAHLSLTQILTSPIFPILRSPTTNLTILSPGTPSTSAWHISIAYGIFRLSVSRAVHESAGLPSAPDERNGGARKHGRDRFVLELDLKAPAMVAGRKGFDRLLKAAEGVLGGYVTWLVRCPDEEVLKVIMEVAEAVSVDMEPVVRELNNVRVPELVMTLFQPDPAEASAQAQAHKQIQTHDDIHELIEYLDLITLSSPRIRRSDDVDPYISSYTVPEPYTTTDLVTTRWSGLIDSGWTTRLLIDLIRASRKGDDEGWVALSAKGHKTHALGGMDGCTVLLLPGTGDVGFEGEGNGLEMEVDVDEAVDQGGDHAMKDVEPAVAAVEKNTEGVEAVGAGEEGKQNSKGLQRFACFQFVDCVRI